IVNPVELEEPRDDRRRRTGVRVRIKRSLRSPREGGVRNLLGPLSSDQLTEDIGLETQRHHPAPSVRVDGEESLICERYLLEVSARVGQFCVRWQLTDRLQHSHRGRLIATYWPELLPAKQPAHDPKLD